MDTTAQLSLDALEPEVFPAQPVTAGVGWSAPQVCTIGGITYRQLDYWARTGLVEPSLQPAAGSGSKRMYSYRDLIVVRAIATLLGTGLSLQNIRIVTDTLAQLTGEDLAAATLFSDGTAVYLSYTADEVVDLLRGGQGVFGIALGPVVTDTRAQLIAFPGQPVADDLHSDEPGAAGASPREWGAA